MRWRRTTPGQLLIGGCCLAAVGCGSTVAGATVAGAGADGVSPGAPAPVAAQNPSGQGSAVNTGTPGSVLANTPTYGGPAGALPSAVAAPVGGAGETRVAVSTKPFNVGALYSSNAQAALTALGGKGSIGDVQAEGDAVRDYVNAHGGVAGRQLILSWYNGDATQSSTAIASQACAYWTQDAHVDAAVPGGSIVDMNTVRTCLAKANVPAVSVEYHVQTRAANFPQSPVWLEPLGLSMEAYARTLAQGLSDQGFFAGGKLGIVYDNGPDWTSVEQSVLEPTLKALHVDIASRASYALRGFADVGPSQSQLTSTVLQFKTAGVNRVITFEPWDGYAFFMQSADQQDFHPLYGLASQAAFAATYATGLVPADQLTGARFVGWSPVLDEPTVTSSWPRLAECSSIMSKAGIQPNGPLATAIAMSTCDGILDIAGLASAVRGNLTAGTFRAALAQERWLSALMPSVDVTADRPYGVTSVRDGAWNASCQCFTFSGPPRATSS